MTDDKLYTSLSANTIMTKLTNQFQRTKHITSSPDKHYSLDSEDGFRSGCQNSHQQQYFSNPALPSNSLIQSICYPELNKLNTYAIRHGCTHEQDAINAYEKTMKETHVNFRIVKCGLFINEEHLFMQLLWGGLR